MCSFLGMPRYFGRGIGSPGLYTLLGHRSFELLLSVLDDVSERDDELLNSRFARSRNGMSKRRYRVPGVRRIKEYRGAAVFVAGCVQR